jgi:hypothetical protein
MHASPARADGAVCVDEIPTLQVLVRDPIRRAIPGSIEQREFDYTRHGTVNMLVFLVVHSGLGRKDMHFQRDFSGKRASTQPTNGRHP